MQEITFLSIGSFTKTANSWMFAKTNSSQNFYFFFSPNTETDGSLILNFFKDQITTQHWKVSSA